MDIGFKTLKNCFFDIVFPLFCLFLFNVLLKLVFMVTIAQICSHKRSPEYLASVISKKGLYSIHQMAYRFANRYSSLVYKGIGAIGCMMDLRGVGETGIFMHGKNFRTVCIFDYAVVYVELKYLNNEKKIIHENYRIPKTMFWNFSTLLDCSAMLFGNERPYFKNEVSDILKI